MTRCLFLAPSLLLQSTNFFPLYFPCSLHRNSLHQSRHHLTLRHRSLCVRPSMSSSSDLEEECKLWGYIFMPLRQFWEKSTDFNGWVRKGKKKLQISFFSAMGKKDARGQDVHSSSKLQEECHINYFANTSSVGHGNEKGEKEENSCSAYICRIRRRDETTNKHAGIHYPSDGSYLFPTKHS